MTPSLHAIYTVCIILFLFQLKHLIVDFFLQYPYMYKNKGTYGHPGGLAHAGLHAFGSFVVLAILHAAAGIILLICFFDFLLHYHIDWAKMYFTQKYAYTPSTEEFWYLLGVDQFLHQLTYIFFIIILAGVI